MSIEDIARELYGLAPEEFTSARNARVRDARDAGDRDLAAAVQALRKPTFGAWLLDQFVRRHDDDVGQLLTLGAQLREAQGTLGAAELRALDRQRRQLTAALAQQVRALGEAEGRRVSAQVTADLEETLRSAMVDAAAGQALATGLLTDTFTSTGLDPVDLARVVALPALVDAVDTPAPTDAAAQDAAADDDVAAAREADHRRRVTAAKEAVAQADSALESASELTRTAEAAVRDATERHDRSSSERDELRRRLDELEAEVTAAAAERDAARRAAEQARRGEAEAREVAARAHDGLDELLG